MGTEAFQIAQDYGRCFHKAFFDINGNALTRSAFPSSPRTRAAAGDYQFRGTSDVTDFVY